MKITENPSLAQINSFGIKAHAGLLFEVECEEDVLTLPAFNAQRDIVLGGGSNVLFRTDVPGSVFLNRILGREILHRHEESVLVEVGAGENWHELVTWSLDQGLTGIENLALIPGSAGAAPIQNIGAYGVELESAVESVTAWDWKNLCWVIKDHEQCRFSYRDSLFKSIQPDRYFITSIRLNLKKQFTPVVEYADLEKELINQGKKFPTAHDVYAAVISLRKRKLPDPAVIGNAGSFFKNPVIPIDEMETLKTRFPSLPCWQGQNEQVKISAAWMIENCGLKGYCLNGAGVSERHALVITNQSNAKGEDVWQLASHVRETVHEHFGIYLQVEPRVYAFNIAN
jgi:UDP-N-acetylmuramate dehydrogenase